MGTLARAVVGGLITFSTWMVDIDTAESGRLSTAIAVLRAIAGVAAGAIGLAMGSSVS